MSKSKNLFATVLTYPAPSSNYRGESEENRTMLQKITKGGKEYTIVSPEAIRNALREMLIQAALPHNRSRLHNEDQLAVEFKEFPDADKYADDFLFGFMVADKDAIKKNSGKPAKRDSVLRLNMAVALTPYRFNAVFNQSPLNAGNSPWKNAANSALIHREVYTRRINIHSHWLKLTVCKGRQSGRKICLRRSGSLQMSQEVRQEAISRCHRQAL